MYDHSNWYGVEVHCKRRKHIYWLDCAYTNRRAGFHGCVPWVDCVWMYVVTADKLFPLSFGLFLFFLIVVLCL